MCAIKHLVPIKGRLGKVSQFYEDLQADGFSVEKKKGKKAQTQLADVSTAYLTFRPQLHLPILAENRGSDHPIIFS